MWGCARRSCPNAPTMVYKCAWHPAEAREGTDSVPGMLTPSRQTDSRPLWGRRSGRFRPGECAPHSLFTKRECAAPGGREKALRRVGLRQRRPPAAGGGWLALPCRSQGRKRTALGESLGPGRFRDTPASLSAAAHASAENQPARSDAERAKREAGQMRSCTPTTSAPSATGRQLGEPQKT